MPRKILLLFFILSLNVALSAQRVGRYGAADRYIADEDIERSVMKEVNNQRRRQGRSELNWDEEIARVAQTYSRRMAAEGFFDHFDPEGNTVLERAAKVKGWSRIGENLFVGDHVANIGPVALRSWMESSTHRVNILDVGWTATGIGIARTKNGEIYITQIFTQE